MLLFYICINYIARKLVGISSSAVFSFDIWSFSVLIYFFWAKSVTLGYLLAASSNFVCLIKTAVVTKPLTSGMFYQYLQVFSLNFVYLCCIDLCELK